VLDAGCDWNRAREQLLVLPGNRPVDRRGDRDARALGDPDAFPVSDLGVRLAATQLGPARRSSPTNRAQCPVATVAVVRHPASVDSTRARGQRMAAEGEVMATLQFRSIDSPVGLLTLAGKDGRADAPTDGRPDL